MRKLLTFIMVSLLCLLCGCHMDSQQNPTVDFLAPPDPSDSTIHAERIFLDSLTQIEAYITEKNADIVSVNTLHTLGLEFEEGRSRLVVFPDAENAGYSYNNLVDANGCELDLTVYYDFASDYDPYINKIRIPFSTKSMAKIESDEVGHAKRNGFTYRYVWDRLNGISWKVGAAEVRFDLSDGRELYEYPLDGKKTLMARLLSVSAWDHWIAEGIVNWAFPAERLLPSALLVTALSAAGVGVILLLRARRAKKKAALSCAAPDAPEPPVPDTL